MNAVLCEGWDGWRALRLADVPVPELRPGCVRIAPSYAGVSFAQLLMAQGKYQRRPPLPFVPGTEVSGTVLEVAPDVTDLRPGDRVAGGIDWGGYGQEAVGTAETLWRVPDGLSLRDATSVPLTYGTAYAALHWRAQLRAGESLLVFGAAGGVGIPAVELGRIAGAEVIAVARTADRLQLALERGARHGLLASDPDLVARLKALTGGRGVDVLFDPVGGDLFEAGLRAMAPMGRLLAIGYASGRIPQVPSNLLLVKNLDLIGFNFGNYLGWSPIDERKRHAPRLREMAQQLFTLAVQGQIKPAAATCWPLADFQQAYAAVEARQSTGRVLIEIAPEPGRA
ncbi:MAG: NADPH:quinone oxidoreductase family protein [Pseudomonadota bacterium]